MSLQSSINKNFSLSNIILIVLFLAAMSSCYTSSSKTSSRTIASRQEQRHNAIIKEVRRDLKVGERYLNYGFGNERTIKPNSFRRLDSLYNAYFEEEQKVASSRNVLIRLRNEIEDEKGRVMQDTIHFQFEIGHFFGVSSGDTATIIHANFLLNNQNEVIHVDIQYLFKIHLRLTQFYQAYIRRESFIDFGFAPSREEDQFYNFFDAIADKLNNFESRGNFIGHMLHVMRAAQQQRGLNTEPLIKQHIINIITGNSREYRSVRWSRVYTNLGENDELISYEVDHHWAYRDPSNMHHEMKRTFVLNPFFEITDIFETSKVRD
jgi:hypothetical protein